MAKRKKLGAPPLPKTFKELLPYVLAYRMKELMAFIIVLLLIVFGFLWFVPDEVVKVIKEIKK
jgi:hypothetical protein